MNSALETAIFYDNDSEEITVERGGQVNYVRGKAKTTQGETFTTRCVSRPSMHSESHKIVEIIERQLPEGLRVEETRVFFMFDEVFPADDSKATQADAIVRSNGKRYLVCKVNDWHDDFYQVIGVEYHV